MERLPQASDLLPLVYEELRALSHSYMRSERSDHSLQPTALVHEAYLRLARNDRMVWRSKSHFFAMAAIQMRRVLVEHARKAHAEKRVPRSLQVSLAEDLHHPAGATVELLAIDEALERLAEQHPREARIAELRLFAGMQIDEIATFLCVSERTVKYDWKLAQAWLARALRSESGER
jgi:RNA polymerase sigma factor (TIGR02999 family)